MACALCVSVLLHSRTSALAHCRHCSADVCAQSHRVSLRFVVWQRVIRYAFCDVAEGDQVCVL